jgi:hypothetical protein
MNAFGKPANFGEDLLIIVEFFTANVRSIIQDKEVQKDLLYRHITYLNILKLQLRKNDTMGHKQRNYSSK